MADVSEMIPYPSMLRRGELIRKVLIVTIEVAENDLRQVTYVSRRQVDGTFACCYHIGRLKGGVFVPEAADSLTRVSAQDVDVRLEAVLSGVRASLEGKFVTHTIYDLTALTTIEDQFAFLASRNLSHLVRTEP